MTWFEEEVFANSLDDFFAKRPVDYTKHDKSITANDLFELFAESWMLEDGSLERERSERQSFSR